MAMHIGMQDGEATTGCAADGQRLALMVAQGMFLALLTLLAFVYCLHIRHDGLDQSRTAAFTVLVIAHLVHAFNCRSNRRSLFALGLLTNKALLAATAGSILLQALILLSPWTHPLFGVTPLDPVHWVLVAGLGVTHLLAMELWKRYATQGEEAEELRAWPRFVPSGRLRVLFSQFRAYPL